MAAGGAGIFGRFETSSDGGDFSTELMIGRSEALSADFVGVAIATDSRFCKGVVSFR